MNNRNSSNFNINSYFEIANSPHQQNWDLRLPENVTNTGANESYPTLTPAISQQIAPDFMNWRQNLGAGREETSHYRQTEVASTSTMNIQSSPNPLLPKSQQKPKLNSKLYQEALARKSELGLDSHRSTALEALRSYSPESRSPPPATTTKKFDMFSALSALTEYQDKATPSVESFQSKQASYTEDLAPPLRSILKKFADGDSPSTSREGLLSPAPQPPAFENIDDEDKYLYGDSPEEGKTNVVEPQNDSYSKWNKSKVSTVQGNVQAGVRDDNGLQHDKDNTRSFVGSAAAPNVAPAIPMNIKHRALGNSSSSVQNKSQDEVIIIPPEESSSNKETAPRAPAKKHYRKDSVNSRVDDIERHVLRYSGKYYDSGSRRSSKTRPLKTTHQTVRSDSKSRVPPIPSKKKTPSKPVVYMVHNETATTKAAQSLKSGIDAKDGRENHKTVPSTFVPLAVRKPAVISKPDKVFKEAEEKLSQKNKAVGNEDIFIEEEPDNDTPASSSTGKTSISKRDTLLQKKQDAFAKAIAQSNSKSNPKVIKKSVADSSSQPKAPEMDRVVRFVKNNKPVPEPKVTLIVKDPYKKRSPSPRRLKKRPYKDTYVPPRSRTAEYEKGKYFSEAVRSRSRRAYDSTYTHRTREYSRSPDRSPYERPPRSPKPGRSERKLHPYSRSPERYYDPRSPYHKEKGSYRYYEKSPVRLSRSRSRSPARYSEELSPDRWSEKSSKEYIGSPRYRSYSPLETPSRYGKRRRSYDRSSSEHSNERDGKGRSFGKLHSPVSTPEVNSPFEDEKSDSDNGEKSSRYSRRDKYEKAKKHARQLSPQVDRSVKAKKHTGELNPQVRTTSNESSVKTPLNKLTEKEVKVPDEGKTAAVSNVERTESTFLNEDPSSSLQPPQVAPSATNDASTGGSKTCEDFFEIITNLRNAGNTASTLLEPTSTYATVAQPPCVPAMHPPNMPSNLQGFNQTQSSVMPVYSQALSYTDAAHAPMSQYSTMDNSFRGHPIPTYSQDFMQNYMQYSPYNVPQQQQPSHSGYYNMPPHYAQALPQTYLPSPPIVSPEVLPPMPQLKSPKKSYHRRIPSLKAIPMDPDVSKSSSMESKQSGPLDSLTESLMSETSPSYHKLKINLTSQVSKQKDREASHSKGNEKDDPSSIKSVKPKEDVVVRPPKEKVKADVAPTKEKSQGGWSTVHEKAGHSKSFQEMKRERDIRKLEEKKEGLSAELKKANNHFAMLTKTKNQRTSKWDDKGINDEIAAANAKIEHILKEHQKTNNALKALIKSANPETTSPQKTVEVISKKPVKKIRYMDCDAYWCEHCNEVFHTSKDMLSHFHASDHFQLMDPDVRYWPDPSEEYNEPGVEYYDLPLKGIQYIVPVKGFYCSICKQCFPDQAIAERHIKSKDHNSQYMKYSEEHPDLTQKYESRRLRAVNLNEHEQKKKRQSDILKATRKIRSSLNKTVMQEVDAQKAIIEANLKDVKDDEMEASPGPTQPRKVVPQIIKFDFADKAKKKIIEEKKAEKQLSTPVVYIGKVTSLLSRSELSKNKKAKTVEKSVEDIVMDSLTKELLAKQSLPENNDSSVNAKKKATLLPSAESKKAMPIPSVESKKATSLPLVESKKDTPVESKKATPLPDSNKASPPVGTDKKNQQKDTNRKSTAVAASVSQKKTMQSTKTDSPGIQKDIVSKEPTSSDKNSSSFFGPAPPPGFEPASKPKKMAKKKEGNAIQITINQEPKKNPETKTGTPLKEIALPKDIVTSLPKKPTPLKEIALPKDIVTSLPEKPTPLKEIALPKNMVTSLPEKPTPLKEIVLPKNIVTSLPEKPALKLDEIMLPKDAPKPIPVIHRTETVKRVTEEKVPIKYVAPTPKPPLSEEEKDFILLGINKLDMQPLAIPKRPPFLLKLLPNSPAKPSESTKPQFPSTSVHVPPAEPSESTKAPFTPTSLHVPPAKPSESTKPPFPPTSLHVPPPSLHVPPPSLHVPPPRVQHPPLHIPPPSLHVPPPPIKFTPNVPMRQMPPRGTIRSLPFHHKPPISFIRPTPSVTTICPVSMPLLKLNDKEEKNDAQVPKALESVVANSKDKEEKKDAEEPRAFENVVTNSKDKEEKKDAEEPRAFENVVANSKDKEEKIDAEEPKAFESIVANANDKEEVKDAEEPKAFESIVAISKDKEEKKDAEEPKAFESIVANANDKEEMKDAEEPKAFESMVANSNDFAETKGQDIPSPSKVGPSSETPQSSIITDEYFSINKEKVEENTEISLVSKTNIAENNQKVACNETQKPSLDDSSVEAEPLGTLKTPDTKSVLSDSVLPSKEEECLAKDIQISMVDSQLTLGNQRTAEIDKQESTAPSKCDESEIKGGTDNSESVPEDSVMEVDDSSCALQSQSANASALVTTVSVTKIHQEPLSLQNASCTETVQPNTLDSQSAVDADLVKPTSECTMASELIMSGDVEETTVPSSENSGTLEELSMVFKANVLRMDVVEKIMEDRSIPEERRQKDESIVENTQEVMSVVEKVQKDISFDEKMDEDERVLEKIMVNEITSLNNAIPIGQDIVADTMANECVLSKESKPEVQSDSVEMKDAKSSVDSVLVKPDESAQETKTLDANRDLQFAMDKTLKGASLVAEVANQNIEKEMESCKCKSRSTESLVADDTTIKIGNHNVAPSQIPAETDATFSDTMQQKYVTCADTPLVPIKEIANDATFSDTMQQKYVTCADTPLVVVKEIAKLESSPALKEQEAPHPKIQAAPVPCVASSSSNPLPTLNSEQMPAQGVHFETYVKQLLENKAVEPMYGSEMQRKDVSNSVQDLVDNIDSNLRNMKPQKKNENSVENARDILLDIVSQVGESTHDSLNWVLSPGPVSEPLKGKKKVLPKDSKTMIRSRPTTRLSAKNALKDTDAKREPILIEKAEQAKEVDSGLSSLSTEEKCMEYENEQKDEVKQSNKGSEVDTAEDSPKCPILVAEIPSDSDSKNKAMKANNDLQKADTLEKLASPVEIQQRKEDSPMPELIAVMPVIAMDTASTEIKALENTSKIPDLSQMEDCHSKDSNKGSYVLNTSHSMPLSPASSGMEIIPMDTDDKALPCSELRPETNLTSCLPENNFASETIPTGTSSSETQLNSSVIPQKAPISEEVSSTKRGTTACSKTQEEKEAESVEKCFSALEAYAKTRFPCDENASSASNSNSGEFGLPKTAPASANNTSAQNIPNPIDSTHLAGTEHNVTPAGIIPPSTNSPETSSSNNVFAGSSMSGILGNTREMDTAATGVPSAKDQEDSSSDDEVIFVASVMPIIPETVSARVPVTIDIESDDSCSEAFPDLALRIKKEKEDSKEMQKKAIDVVTIEADECEDSNTTQDKEAEEKEAVVKPDIPETVVNVKKEPTSCFDYGVKASSAVSKILETVEKSIKKEKPDDRKEKICVFKDFPFKTGIKQEKNEAELPVKGTAKVKKEKEEKKEKAPGKKTNEADEDTDTDEYETIE